MDIKCVVCGEPWDAYGVTHGDMLRWEAKLFKAGAGCPSCEGVPNGWTPETLSDVENGDEDPMLRIVAAERVADGTKPEWKRPDDVLLWSCDGCNYRVLRDADDGELTCTGGGYYSRPEPTEDPEHRFENDTCVCEKCYETCDECGEPIPPGDDNGAFPSPKGGYYENRVVCGEDCLSAAEHEESLSVWRNCYSPSERLAYIREHESQFDMCFARWNRDPIKAWRCLLANVRGEDFCGYASELLA